MNWEEERTTGMGETARFTQARTAEIHPLDRPPSLD